MSYNTHGLSKSETYRSWQRMKTRCLDSTYSMYRHYGGRGIKVCAQWLSFENFLRDMGLRPTGKELDRQDNNGDYTPENCRWATKSQNQRNKRVGRNNISGVSGVSFSKGVYWVAKGKLHGKSIFLYNGKDFFEACCARKSWEVKGEEE